MIFKIVYKKAEAVGLFMYLDREQTRAVLRNICSILKVKGGCFVTQDFSTKKFLTAVAEALYPQQGKEIYAASAKMYNATSGDIMFTEYGDDSFLKDCVIAAELLNADRINLRCKFLENCVITA